MESILDDIKALNEAMIKSAQESTFDTIVGPAEETAERKAVLKGGYYSLGRKDYWIPGEFYKEVEDKDFATPTSHKGTQEFGRWLKEFLKKHKIKEDTKKNTRSLAGYWAMPYTYDVKGTGPSSSYTIKMASVLRAARSIVSVVDPEHKCTVEYALNSTSSAWDSGNKIFLPVEPINKVIDLEDCINVMGGFSIHESWHSIQTRSILDEAALSFIGDEWNMWIMNLIEDVRIEYEGLKETPGYVEYLNYTKEYVWSDKGLPSAWPAEPEKRFQTAIGLIRYSDRIDEILTDPSFETPRVWLRDWVNRYVEAQSDKATSAKMIKFVNEGREFFEIPEGTRPDSKTLKTLMMPCAITHFDNGADKSRIIAVDEAIEEETESASSDTKAWDKIFGDSSRKAGYGALMSSVVIRRPKPVGKYVASRGDLIEKAKAALVLRKTEPQNDTRIMRTGILDEDELYRFSTGDVRIFKDATIESLPSASVTLLVDMSGSMGYVGYDSSAAYYAVKMAQLLVEGLSKNPRVKLKVLGHTGGNRDNEIGGSFYRIWEPGDSMDRLSILADHSLYSQNYDGWAIAWAGNMLKHETSDQKLLIVLADGMPAANNYGGPPATKHVRQITDSLLRAGVYTIQVAVSPFLDEGNQKEMFKHYIAMNPDGSAASVFPVLLRKLTKVLTRIV